MEIEQDRAKQEQGKRQYNIQTIKYRTPNDAANSFSQFSEQDKDTMAEVYQAAFGGEPWNERFRCTSCGIYLSENTCSQCAQRDIPEAYPKDELKTSYFPQMLQEFTPGGILIAKNQMKNIVGFSTGGFTTLEELIEQKYGDNRRILNDIVLNANVSPRNTVFYDNETCILPTEQKGGIGRQFSQRRIDLAIDMNAELICGRTINLPWLKVKEQQLTNMGYAFSAFVPQADTYAVNGNPRQFYIARKK